MICPLHRKKGRFAKKCHSIFFITVMKMILLMTVMKTIVADEGGDHMTLVSLFSFAHLIYFGNSSFKILWFFLVYYLMVFPVKFLFA